MVETNELIQRTRKTEVDPDAKDGKAHHDRPAQGRPRRGAFRRPSGEELPGSTPAESSQAWPSPDAGFHQEAPVRDRLVVRRRLRAPAAAARAGAHGPPAGAGDDGRQGRPLGT